RGLSVGGRRQRIAGPRERDEERVALGVDLDPAVLGERSPQSAPVLGQRIRIRVAELVQQAGRPLDVREEEGDGAGGELSHPAIIRRSGGGWKRVVLVQLLAAV